MSDDPQDFNDPIEEEALEMDEPQRREQSAEFAVSEDAGSQAQMRQAMDPANQRSGPQPGWRGGEAVHVHEAGLQGLLNLAAQRIVQTLFW